MAQKPYEDYGHLYRKDPSRIEKPRGIEALARVLKRCNDSDEPVTIRNTAHSTGGQTLTRDVQVSLENITGTTFNREAMTITCGAGNSWDSVLTSVKFPEYCLPLFPNNPGQKIRIGGTAGVGGVGYYGSHVGGFWNAVRSMKLVTMRGEIIECSRKENFELMRYSLGGFGRIGVIAEMTIDVVESKPDVMGMLLIYRCGDQFETDLIRAMNDPMFSGVAGQEDIPSTASLTEGAQTKLDLKILTVILEVDADNQTELKRKVRAIRLKYNCAIQLFMKLKDSNMDVSLDITTFPKREMVYFSPQSTKWWVGLIQLVCQKLTGGRFRCINPREDPRIKHPWNDCVLPMATYGDFMSRAKHLISKAGFAKCIAKQSIFHGLINVDSFVVFVIKKHLKPSADGEMEYPLSLDLPNDEPASMGLAIMPDLMPEEAERLPDLLKMCNQLTDLAYEMGGRRYLYGYHDLTKKQIEQQYGVRTIQTWNALKKRLDPKGLLNRGVVSRYLDDYPEATA